MQSGIAALPVGPMQRRVRSDRVTRKINKCQSTSREFYVLDILNPFMGNLFCGGVRFAGAKVMLAKYFGMCAVVAAAYVFNFGPAFATVVFSDNFNSGANAAWGNQRGSWRASDGVYDAASPSNSPVTYTDVLTLPSLTDFVLDVDVNALDDGGIWLRSNYNGGAINGVLLVTGGNTGTYDGLYWHIVQNGGFSGSSNSASQAGLQETNHHLHIVVSGDTYTVYLDYSSSSFTSLTTALFASGSAGLYDYSPTSGANSPRGQTFDNFTISVNAVPAPPALTLFATGLGALGLLGWCRKRKAQAVA